MKFRGRTWRLRKPKKLHRHMGSAKHPSLQTRQLRRSSVRESFLIRSAILRTIPKRIYSVPPGRKKGTKFVTATGTHNSSAKSCPVAPRASHGI